MKELTKLFSMLLIVLALGFTSCGSDDKDDDAPSPQISLADKVAGTYSGRLSLGETVLEDAYIVTVTKQYLCMQNSLGIMLKILIFRSLMDKSISRIRHSQISTCLLQVMLLL